MNAPPSSDFYAARRTVFADVGGLAGMGVGALLAAMNAWKYLATGFRTGEMEKAMAIFIGLLVAAGAAGGFAGLGAGRWFGARWERRHRLARPVRAEDGGAAAILPTLHEPPTVGTLAARPLSAEAQRALAIAAPTPGEATPWGIWDGPQLVGIAWVNDDRVTGASAIAGYDAARLARAVGERLSR